MDIGNALEKTTHFFGEDGIELGLGLPVAISSRLDGWETVFRAVIPVYFDILLKEEYQNIGNVLE